MAILLHQCNRLEVQGRSRLRYYVRDVLQRHGEIPFLFVCFGCRLLYLEFGFPSLFTDEDPSTVEVSFSAGSDGWWRDPGHRRGEFLPHRSYHRLHRRSKLPDFIRGPTLPVVLRPRTPSDYPWLTNSKRLPRYSYSHSPSRPTSLVVSSDNRCRDSEGGEKSSRQRRTF